MIIFQRLSGRRFNGWGLGEGEEGPLIFPENQGQWASFSITVAILLLSFKWATTAPNKLIDSQQYILFIKCIIGRKKGVENFSRVWFEGESRSRMVSIQTLGFRG